LTASWLTQHVQCRAQLRASDLHRRAQLDEHFIEEASQLYADASEHHEAATAQLVNLSALVSKTRVLSSPRMVANADSVIRVIIETYLATNKTFHEVVAILDNEAMHPLRALSHACREALRGRGAA
jgi:hypothetical protein